MREGTLEPIWARLGAENAPRTYFHRSEPFGFYLGPLGFYLEPFRFYLAPVGFYLRPFRFFLGPFGLYVTGFACKLMLFGRLLIDFDRF